MNVTTDGWAGVWAGCVDYWRGVLADAVAGSSVADGLIVATVVLVAALVGAWLTAGFGTGEPLEESSESPEEYGRRVLGSKRRGGGHI